MTNKIPGATPRGCYACYRGNLAADPREINSDNRTFASARMGVNMASPDVPAEARDELTEWVSVMASEALRTKLFKCKKGEAIVVMGNVPLKPYMRRGAERSGSTARSSPTR